MAIETTCRRCGAPYTATHEDVKKGPDYWRLCPNCRPAESTERQEPPPAAA